MWPEFWTMVGLTILQSAAFTLNSRARNSPSIMYHAISNVLSNGLYLIVLRQVVLSIDDLHMQIAYSVGMLAGALLMHYIAMKYFEKDKSKKTDGQRECMPSTPDNTKSSSNFQEQTTA